MEAGDTLCLEFDGIAARGDAIANAVDPPVYAAGVIPGERAQVRIRRLRKNWTAVDVESIARASPHRVTPRCPLFEVCSGCQLQHIAYPHQLELKRAMVAAQLERFGELSDPPVAEVIGAADPWHYRNHARFTVREGRLGFIRRFRREWLEVPQCPIMNREINAILAQFQGELGDASQCNIRVGRGGTRTISPKLDVPAETGQPSFVETLNGRSFRVSTASFFQVNPAQAEQLVRVVVDAAATNPEATVVDAYAGVGTFAAFLSERVARVIAIEESAQAIEDARHNLAGCANVELLQRKSEEALTELDASVDSVILDPPRSGCRPPALSAVRRLAPARIVYVSCDAASLARDLRALLADGLYQLLAVQPVDMFPHTHHVECVATLVA